MAFLIKLLGIHADDGSTLSHPTFALHGQTPLGWIILIFMALAAAAVWLYLREDARIGRIHHWSMMAFRVLFLAMLCLVLLRPVVSLTMQSNVRRSLILLVDTSKSMGIKDQRIDPADLRRAAMAMNLLVDPRGGLDQPLTLQQANAVSAISRADVLKAMLHNPRLHLLSDLSQQVDLKWFAFGDSMQGNSASPMTQPIGVDPIDALQPWGATTAIGDELRKAINRTRGQPLAGILLLTDGGNNAGADPIMAARAARDEGVAVYSYGLGISSPRDIVVADVFTPNDIVFANDQVPVNVRVQARNLAGESAKLVLTLGGQKMDEKTIDLSEPEQMVAMKMTPPKKGIFDLVASIAPRADEADRSNNTKQRRIQVIDDKIKVLLVDQTPRWEFKYLMQQMQRDRRMDLKVFLVDGDPGLSQQPDSVYLPAFPNTLADLSDKYDVIILGDVDPKVFTGTQIQNMYQFVAQQGGGLIMVAGRNFAPTAYVDTPIEKLLPVQLLPTRSYVPGGPDADVFDKPIHLELTPTGARNGMLRLGDKDDQVQRQWQNLPPVFWTAHIGRVKPLAQPLLVDPDPSRSTRGEKMPVIALQQYQLGQVLYVGTDNTWRWRRNKGDSFYITLWGQMIYRTALNHLLGAKRTRLEQEKSQYTVGEPVTFYAHVYDTSYSPVTDETITGYYMAVDGAAAQVQHQVMLRRVPSEPGMYKGQFTAITPGNYQFHLDKPADPEKKENFSITESTVEFGDTAMNAPLLQEIAHITGGEFFREENLWKLPDAIRAKNEKISWNIDVELWSTKLFFAAALALVTAEWILRKAAQLK